MTSRSGISLSRSWTSSIASACTSGSHSTPKGEAVDLLVHDRDADPAHVGADLFRRYGCFASSREKPAGPPADRYPRVPLERLAEVIAAVQRALDDGARVYWICPLVEESETIDLAASRARFNELKERFGDRGRSGPRPDAEAPTRTAPWSALRRRDPAFSSRPRWSKSASMCPRQPSW